MKAKIHYYDIGDYLSREEKLKTIERFGSIENIPWTIIEPNEHGDWLNKRSELFKLYIPIEPNKKFNKLAQSFFIVNSRGFETGRDAWIYHSSTKELKTRVSSMIDFYNNQRQQYWQCKGNIKMEDFISYDSTKISWTSSLLSSLNRNKIISYKEEAKRTAVYRPYFKQNAYTGNDIIHRVGQMPEFFPTPKHRNLLICISGVGVTKDFSCVIVDVLPDLELIGKSQCFPLYWYEDMSKEIYKDSTQLNLFIDSENSYIRRDGVTDWILTTARKQYGSKVTKEDIFYYVYGILHSPDYRTAFAADLKKSLPRLPLVESSDDFWAFSHAGRELAELHLNYETVEPYKSCISVFAALTTKGENVNYRVEKMRFGKIDSKTADKTIIHYNNGITIESIPLEAYEYVVNGKSAIEWIMERYQIKPDPASGITNDPNDWAKEHNDEKYIFNLLLRIINVSVKTMAIVKALPKFKFEE